MLRSQSVNDGLRRWQQQQTLSAERHGRGGGGVPNSLAKLADVGQPWVLPAL